MKPIIRWVGGKSKILNQLLPLVPSLENRTYIEPFLGGGSMFLSLVESNLNNCVEWQVSDVNQHLIEFYRQVIYHLDDLKSYWEQHSADFVDTKEAYYASIDRLDQHSIGSDELALRFLHLNKCGFNGLWRVNKSGKYNTPYGHNPKYRKTPVKVFDYDKLSKFQKLLTTDGLMLTCSKTNYEDIYVPSNAFVYLDPPYIPLKYNSFDNYVIGGFGHHQLARWVHWLDKNNIQFMMSQSDTETSRELYKRYKITTISAPRNVAGDDTKRKNVSELIITNY